MRSVAAALLSAGLLLGGGCAGPLPRGAGPAGPARAAAAFAPAVSYGTYEWSAADLVSRWHSGTLWPLLAAKHVDDVLAGFDDAYIAKCSTAKGAAEMNALIADAAAHGVRVELLLGDPGWILPSGVAGLKKILRELRAVKFSGVDLDLEPNEVKGVPIERVLRDLVAAMRAYIGASPWPVSLDVNHFYVDPEAGHDYTYCLMCGLERAGLKRVNLMTYVSNPRTVVADVAPILARYPSVTFAIGQSVEPPSVLPPSDSYWGDGFTAFYRDMQRLDASLAAHANYGGIVIESMYYLERMKENT
jgi:hypothetical protein